MSTSVALIMSLKYALSIGDVLIRRKYEKQVLNLERKLNAELNKDKPYNNVIDNINDELCAITLSISNSGKKDTKL